MSKRLIRFSFPLLVILAVYFVGPSPAKPAWSDTEVYVPEQPDELEAYIAKEEGSHKLKRNNEARIVWADSTRQRTPISIVYLHGFSASQMEGDPIHREFAKEFGCNLFLARMPDHGVDTTDAMINYSADRSWRGAKEALAIGKELGDRVIVMSTSTGGTLALMLAATFPDDVFALINMSPNVAVNNDAAFLLNDPWGLQIARMVTGGKYRVSADSTGETADYWYSKYRLEALVGLEELVESSMTDKTFSKVTQPCLTLYYYKDEDHQDPQVKVDAIREMMAKIATPENKKRAVAIPEAGAHVIGSSLVSKDVESVYNAIEDFAINVLGMVPVAPGSAN